MSNEFVIGGVGVLFGAICLIWLGWYSVRNHHARGGK